MCGIVGYVGSKQALSVVVDGLRRLEYRGYDSAGVAVVSDEKLEVRKKAGKLEKLQNLLGDDPLPSSTCAIGHTRWATHGVPNDTNAHPHIDQNKKIAVIHNGIIENFSQLRSELEQAGTLLTSDTDTEVVAHLLALEYPKTKNLTKAMQAVVTRLRGAFTLVAISADQPDLLIGARRNSPLVVGRGDGENFLASDVSAFISHTKAAIELGQDQIVELTSESVKIINFDGSPAQFKEYEIDWDISAAEKGGFDLFMLKEISEQPQAVRDTLAGRINEKGVLNFTDFNLDQTALRNMKKIVFIACGTAYHAGLIGKQAVERWTRLPAEAEIASEFRYRDPILDAETLVVAISQSGETMDTLMAVKHAKEQKAKVLAITNTQGSTLGREADAVLYTRAGPEIAVASTKAFLTQVVAVELLALYLAQVREVTQTSEIKKVLEDIADMSHAIDVVLDTMPQVKSIAQKYKNAKSVLYIGRQTGYPVALEGALKLKELAYMHAEGFPAGELKHGPIALIENEIPVVVVVPSLEQDPLLHEKIISNIQEVKARGASVIALAEADDEVVSEFADHVIRLPKVPSLLQPLVATVPLQVFAAELATVKGHDVDQPRNLAKSVTVE
ncbi:MAG: glutamine--fructose-6-phosphate transaminase (isomerizing) [Candidatus Nanopelagicales bacterium]|jgi:glucosamine--fructose-6-phosphate aminotransferase (isomerizing)